MSAASGFLRGSFRALPTADLAFDLMLFGVPITPNGIMVSAKATSPGGFSTNGAFRSGVVEIHVLGVILAKLKILYSIIRFYSVDMVNHLIVGHVSSNMLLHNQAMFLNVIAYHKRVIGLVNHHVSVPHMTTAFPVFAFVARLGENLRRCYVLWNNLIRHDIGSFNVVLPVRGDSRRAFLLSQQRHEM